MKSVLSASSGFFFFSVFAGFSALNLATSIASASFQLGPSQGYYWSTDLDYGDDEYLDASIDSGGTVYTIGMTDGPLTEFSHSRRKMFIQRWDASYDKDGAKRWQIGWLTPFQEPIADYTPEAIRALESNALLIFYRRWEFSMNDTSYWLAKIDKATGSILWQKEFEDIDTARWVTSKEGERFVTVERKGNSSVIKCYDGEAKLSWSQTIPFQVYSLQFAPGDQLLLGGWDEPNNTIPLPAYSRLDRLGKFVHTVLRSPAVDARPITATVSDNAGNGYAIKSTRYNQFLNITKYSASGDKLWEKEFAQNAYWDGFSANVMLGRLVVLKNDLYVFNLDGEFEAMLDYTPNVGEFNGSYRGRLNGTKTHENGLVVSVGKNFYANQKDNAEISFQAIEADPALIFENSGGWQAYLAANVDVFTAGYSDEASAFAHWRDYGRNEGRKFDSGRLRSDLPGGVADPQYAIDGGFAWQYPDTNGVQGNTMVFITKDAPKPAGWDGRALLLRKSEVFNLGPEYTAAAYGQLNSDVKQAIESNLFPSFASVTDHYVKYGFKEGRLTNGNWTQAELDGWFDEGYLNKHSDVRSFFMGAQGEGWKLLGKIGFAHYINFGRWEGRATGQ